MSSCEKSYPVFITAETISEFIDLVTSSSFEITSDALQILHLKTNFEKNPFRISFIKIRFLNVPLNGWWSICFIELNKNIISTKRRPLHCSLKKIVIYYYNLTINVYKITL